MSGERPIRWVTEEPGRRERAPVYLDNNATTPLLPAVWEAMRPYLTTSFGNPASAHWAGRRAANQLTNRALDPLSKIPEFKVSAVRIERVGPPGSAVVDERQVELVEGDEDGA